jgi:DNA repair protein RadC
MTRDDAERRSPAPEVSPPRRRSRRPLGLAASAVPAAPVGGVDAVREPPSLVAPSVEAAPLRVPPECHAERHTQVPERLSTPDLLAVLLGPASRAPAAVRCAWRLLDRFPTLRRLAVATPGELSVAGGLSPESASRLAAAFALGRRAAQQRMPIGASFRSSLDIFERYHPVLRDAKKERFLVVLLDAKNRVMRDEQVSEGHLTSALVHPREVFGVAMRESASALLCVHNHPSGDPEPSTEDVELTRRLVAVGELVGIRILDHLIVGDGAFVSFLDRGWIHP